MTPSMQPPASTSQRLTERLVPTSQTVRTIRRRLRASPAGVVAVLCLAQLLIWTLLPALTNLALPVDVMEGYLWGREWVIATYKHPALPSWVLEFSWIVTGQTGWPAYLVSQLFVCATMALIYHFGREIMDARRGAAAALLTTGILFFSWSSPEFNHNVAQMPFWIGFVWALWRATRSAASPAILTWLLVAVSAAACIYTKLSCLTLLVTGGLWTLWDTRARQSLATAGPWIALAAFVLLTAPLLRWLWLNDFLPLAYAERRATHATSVAIPEFLLGQIGRHGIMFAMLAYAGLLWGSKRPAPEWTEPPATAADARVYLYVMAAGPPVALMLASVALGMNMKPAWTASMATLSGLVAICLCSHRVTSWTYARLVRIAAVAMIATALVYVYDASKSGRSKVRYRPQQASWPADAIADTVLRAWAAATPAPLRIVVGETRIAGIAAVQAPSRPSLLTEGEFWRSPWITPERLAREGALFVWSEPGGMDTSRLKALAGPAVVHHVQIAWPRAPKKPPLELYYAVRPPQPAP